MQSSAPLNRKLSSTHITLNVNYLHYDENAAFLRQASWFYEPEIFFIRDHMANTNSKMPRFRHNVNEPNSAGNQSHVVRQNERARLIFACMPHPSMSYRAGWSYVIDGWLDFHPTMSSCSSNQAALCIQPKIRHTCLFYLTI